MPLVDVMLVLLIIFMVTAPMIQRGVDVNLPVARRAAQIAGERIFVTVPLAYRQSHIVYLGDEPIRVEVLQERVRQKMENRTDKQVYLRGDGGVQLQELMDVFDRLKAPASKTSASSPRCRENDERARSAHGVNWRWTSPTFCAIGCTSPPGCSSMVVVSVAVHAVLVGVVLFGPGRWLERDVPTPPTVMTISLGGGGGTADGGMTSIGGRPVQAETPPEEPKREPVRPPAAKAPEMTVPTPQRAERSKRPTVVKQAPDEARGRTPTRGAQASEGSAIAETGARGQGFGLSSGGAGLGSTLDVANFCCPDYLALMIERDPPQLERRRRKCPGRPSSSSRFSATAAITEPASRNRAATRRSTSTRSARCAITRQLPPLPEAFPNPTLTVHLNFQYQR